MADFRITLSAATRARDVSRPREADEPTPDQRGTGGTANRQRARGRGASGQDQAGTSENR